MSTEEGPKEVSVELPGGIKGRVQGYHLGNILQLVMAAVLTAATMILYDLRQEAKASGEKTSKQVSEEHDKLRISIDRGAEAQEELNYIITLSTEDRERLGLGMPESLRKKLITRNGYSTHSARPREQR